MIAKLAPSTKNQPVEIKNSRPLSPGPGELAGNAYGSEVAPPPPADDAPLLAVCATPQTLTAADKLRSDFRLTPLTAPLAVQQQLEIVPPDCDGIVVECCSQYLTALNALRQAADSLGVPLLGLVSVSPPDVRFEHICDGLVWLSDSAPAKQATQHLRWHARMTGTPRSLDARTQANKRLSFFKPYAAFFRNSADGMVAVSYAGEVLYANFAAKAFATQHPTSKGTNVLDFLAPNDRRRAAELAKALQTGHSPISSDFVVSTTSGPRVINVSASAILKTPKAILLAFRDVTSQWETERALTHTKDFLERVIDSSVDAIVSADLKGNILVFNRAASRIFGYPPGTVIGRLNVRDLYPPGGAQAVMKRIRSPEDGGSGRLEGYETFMVDRQGQPISVRLSAALVREDGRPVATVGVFTDIRQELAMRQRLHQAETDLREKEKGVALAELAGMTAHELNQPLTCVLSYSELLQKKCTQPDVTAAASVIIGQAQRMAEIVRRIGRITRYETKTYVGGTSILDLDKAANKNGDSPE